MNILIIEDDKGACLFLNKGLRHRGCFCEIVMNGKKGLKKIIENIYDLAIIDLSLPDLDGVSIIKKVREKGVKIPIIVLTANHDVSTKTYLFEVGIDDYIIKPFSFDELHARILSIARRIEGREPTAHLQVANLELIPEQHVAKRGGRQIKLRPKEYALLEYLMQHKNQAVSRNTLLEAVWGYNSASLSNTVDTHMGSLRRKINGHFKKKLLITVHGVGYKIKSG